MQILNLNSRVIIENGITEKLEEILKKKKFKRALFCIDNGFFNSKIWNKYEKIFKKIKFQELIINCNSEPTYNLLNFYLSKVRKMKIDVVVAFGGGSCMDYSKAIAALYNKKGHPIKFRGFDKVKKPGIPCICIPTTAGTGSEASHNASFVDTKKKIKMGINGNNMFTELSILDAKNVVSCPKKAAISSAVDAFVHAVEGFSCKKSNQFTDLLAIEVLRLFKISVLDLNKKKPNLKKRLNLLYAAYLSGIIQMNSGSGISSAMSYPLSAIYKVPHGIGGGIFILDVVDYNIKNGYSKYKLISKHLNLKKNSSKSFLMYFKNVFKKLNVPTKLSYFKITHNQVNTLYKKTILMQNSFDQNPVKFDIRKNYKNFIKKYL